MGSFDKVLWLLFMCLFLLGSKVVGRESIVGRKGAEVGHRTWKSVVDPQIRSTQTNNESQNHNQPKLTEVVDNWVAPYYDKNKFLVKDGQKVPIAVSPTD